MVRSAPVLSFSDLIATIKKLRLYFLLAGVGGGIFLFLCFGTKGISYEAKGIFLASKAKPNQLLSIALGDIGGGKTAYEEDPQSHLLSAPVLQEVVEQLQLQGCLQRMDPPHISRLKLLYHNLLNLKAHSYYRYHPPATNLYLGAPVLEHPLFVPSQQAIELTHLSYGSPWKRTLELRFLAEGLFEVFEGGEVFRERTARSAISI